MSYTAVDTAAKATRAAGDLLGRIEVALVKKAALTVNALATADDQRQKPAAQSIIDGSRPASWVTMVLILLDIAGTLANPTDAQIDTAVDTAWAYITKSR